MPQIEIILPELHQGQIDIFKQTKRFNVIVCGRRFGKTIMAIDVLAQMALDGFPVAYFTPKYSFLMPVWNTFKLTFRDIIKKKDEQQKTIELITGGTIEFWSLEDPHAGRSRKYKRIVIDEAAFVPKLEEIWTQAIRPTLTDFEGDAYIMSSPKGRKNYFFTLSEMAKTKKNWATFFKTTYDNPYIKTAEIDEARDNLDSATFQQEYMAKFVDLEGNPFFYNWNPDKNIKHFEEIRYVRNVPIYISFDFNKKNSAVVAQIFNETKTINFIEEYQQGGVGLDLQSLVRTLATNYAGSFIFITGDASGNAQNAFSADNVSAYQQIAKAFEDADHYLVDYERVTLSNPRTANVRMVVNSILKNTNVYNSSAMTITNSDVLQMKVLNDGSLNKADADKHDYGHLGDCWRYLLYNFCYDWHIK